jgi:hypothetical protein
VYVFGTVVVFAAVVAPFDHAYVAPATFDVADQLIVVRLQYKMVSTPAFAIGAVMFWLITIASLAVHPFNGFVTVTVYVLGTVVVFAAVVAPFDHAYVAPATFDVADQLIVVRLQYKIVSTPAFAIGAVMFWLITIASLAVHPFNGFVTVTVYVLGTVVVFAAVVAPFDHAYVAPATFDVADQLIVVRLQYKMVSTPAFAIGAVMFWLITIASLAVHPFNGFVTVTV